MRERATLLLTCLFLAQAPASLGQYASASAPMASVQQVVAPATTQSPEPAIDCAGHSDGLYVRNPNECNDGFYKCANGRSFYYRCPTGLFFSIEDAQCEYRQLIPACGGQRPIEVTSPAPVAPVQNQAYQNSAPTYNQPAQAPVYAQPTQAPILIQQTTTQAPVYQPPQTQAPVYQQPQTQAHAYQQPQTQAPVLVQQPAQPAPTYAQQAPTYTQPEVRPQAPASVPSYQISYAQQPAAPVAVQQPSYQQYGSPQAPQLVASTQAPVDFNCGSNPDGYYYKQQCTSTYYSCIGAIAAKLTCPGGTVYDPVVHSCDYADVCGKPRPTTTTTQAPLVNYGYGWQAPTTQAPSTQCVGKLDGFYARGHCVPQYLHCSNGMAFDLKCPSGLVFRQDACTFLTECLSPTSPAPIAIQTPALPTPPPLTWCRDNQRPSGYYSQGCSANYYSCNGGFTQQITCPASLVYNQQTHECEERQYVQECGGSPRPPTTTTIPTPQKPVNFNCANKPTGYYTNMACSSTYYHCNGGFAQELTCPANLAYDQQIHECEERRYVQSCGGQPRPATTTSLPSPVAVSVNFNCANKPTGYYSSGCTASYYHCSGGFAQELTCPANLAYDHPTNACEERQFVRACGGSPRPPTTTTIATPQKPVNFDCVRRPTGYYTKAACSSTYYHCNMGTAQELLCPANLAYDQPTNTCEERQFVRACGGSPRPPTTTSLPSPVALARPVNFNCAGKADGYYSTGCTTTYYSCNGGTAIEAQCPTGTNYSPQLHACDYRTNVPECGGVLPTTTQTAPIAVAGGNSGYGYAAPQQYQAPAYVQQTTQAPVYQQPQTQAPVYQQPQTQAPVLVAPTTTQAPAYVQPTTTQAPVYQQPQTQAPVYQEQQYGPSAPSYQQPQQAVSQQATAPVAFVQQQTDNSADTNQCAHLQNGIYGRRCSRHYFVCTDHKIFEFTCPSGYAYDRTIARCGPVQQIQGCDATTAAQPQPPMMPQPQARHFRYRK